MDHLFSRERTKLSGFNNLTKALSFNLYDFCAGHSDRERRAYREYIAHNYSAARITKVLRGICDIIEAKVIDVSEQDYDPWGASTMILMSDLKGSGVQLPYRNMIAQSFMHLDKSHICAHTYPDFQGGGTICSIRVDIDIATCGEISPLNALNYMFEAFESDVVVIDYVVRGFTRDDEGRRVYIDHPLRSIQDFISPRILDDYFRIDLALQSDNIWQTKMLRVKLDEQAYFLDPINPADPMVKEKIEAIKREMRGILHMWPD